MNCIVCGKSEFRNLVTTHDRHYGIRGEFNVVACKQCGLICLNPIPTEADLLRFYGDDYYAYVSPERASWWKRFGRRILRSPIPTHDPPLFGRGDFLDIGCGAGEYLNTMRDRGWRVCGVEPVLAGAQAGWNTGLDIRHGTLLDAKFPDESFDYVRSNHSFEHVINPLEVLREIKRILRPGGKLFIGVPNAKSLPAVIFGRYWWYMGVPLHPFTYSVDTLKSLVENAGLRVEKVYFNSNFASITGSLQIYLNRNTSRMGGDGWMFRNTLMKLTGNFVARLFDIMHFGDAIEIICRKEG